MADENTHRGDEQFDEEDEVDDTVRDFLPQRTYPYQLTGLIRAIKLSRMQSSSRSMSVIRC